MRRSGVRFIVGGFSRRTGLPLLIQIIPGPLEERQNQSMKKSLYLSIVGILTFLSLATQQKVDCPSLECLERGCRLAETANRLQIPPENWPEFARQFGNDEFCGDMSCCCSDHR